MRTGMTIQKKKILIIDDDADLLELLQEFLGSQGFDIRASQAASDIIDITGQYQPDLVILDYLLNGINGGELCHQIKTSPFGKKVPVILFSASPRVLLSLGTYGCDQFIPKPFDLDFFLESIRRLLSADNGPFNLADASKNYRPGHILTN